MLKVAVPVACAVAAVVALLVQNETVSELREENAALLSARQAIATNEPSVISTDNAEAERLQREKLELLRLRGEVGRLRREMAERISAHTAGVVSNETTEAESPKESTQQINVKARFVTGSDEALESFGLPSDSARRVVTQTEMEAFLKLIEEGGNIELLASQQVTTLSGRQAQVSSSSLANNTVVVESGCVLDVLPTVYEDGYSMQLILVVSKYAIKRFEPDENGIVKPAAAHPVDQFTTSAPVLDGQHIALSKRFDGKKVVILVTPTLIAPDGNRVHPDSGQ